MPARGPERSQALLSQGPQLWPTTQPIVDASDPVVVTWGDVRLTMSVLGWHQGLLHFWVETS